MQSPAAHRPAIYAEIKAVLLGYLDPHIGDRFLPVSSPASHNKVMICPTCQSLKIAKNGHHKNRQRYICKDCQRQFSDRQLSRGYPPEVKQQCLDLRRQGHSFREIERQTGVSHNTVINWVKQQ
jgi:transposase-like protein